MTDPVHRELSLLEWIRTNKLEASRRLVIGSILGGVLLYIYGEIVSRDKVVVPFIVLVGSIAFFLS